MTRGGPAGASSTMATYMVDNGINSLRMGYATAVAVILFGICFVVSLLYQIFVLRRDLGGPSGRVAAR
jgi:raffinose/stachyose/melibiose transport system permease protein